MGRTRWSESVPKRPGRHAKNYAALAHKNGFDGHQDAPWRKTPSIFKQPVTLVHTTSKSSTKMPESAVKKYQSVTHSRERLGKPQQIFWAKRLEGLKAMVPVHSSSGSHVSLDDEEYIEQRLRLANKIESAVTSLNEEAAAASFSSALQLCNGLPITGNQLPQPNANQNLNYSQPFVQIMDISEQDIYLQEKRVIDARKRLQDLRKSIS